MKLPLCLLYSLGAIQFVFGEGCPSPSFESSLKNSHYFWTEPKPYIGKIDTVSKIDSFQVRIKHNGHLGCGYFKDLMVYRNNALLLSDASQWDGSKAFKLYGLSGHYKVYCYWMNGGGFWWEFDLVYIPNDSFATSISEVKGSDHTFLFYPNPATDILFIENESDNIEALLVYNSAGELIIHNKPYATKIVLPLNNWPKGLYLFKVATRSHSVYIKRILVE